MAKVFISFFEQDALFAGGVETFIRGTLGEDVKLFLSSDASTVYAGEAWLDRIVKELKELKGTKVVVLMLSPESAKRPRVNFEAGAARIKNIPLIPVCFRGLTKDTLPQPFSSLNIRGVNLSERRDQYYLVKSIAHYLGLPEPEDPDQCCVDDEQHRKRVWAPYESLGFLISARFESDGESLENDEG